MANSKRSNKGNQHQDNRDSNTYRIFDDVLDLASTMFRNRKTAGAEKLQALADSTRAYAASITDLPTLQRQVNLAAENIGHFSDYVLNTDIRTMSNDAVVLARQRPLLVLGVAAASGLAATRFMTSGSAAPTRAPSRRRTAKKASKAKVVQRKAMNGSAHANA